MVRIEKIANFRGARSVDKERRLWVKGDKLLVRARRMRREVLKMVAKENKLRSRAAKMKATGGDKAWAKLSLTLNRRLNRRLNVTKKQKNRRAVREVRKLFRMAHRGQYFNEAWALVTALRGPDEWNEETKRYGTTRIRRALLTIKMCGNLAYKADFGRRPYQRANNIADHVTNIGHFGWHVHEAAKVINYR
jgi:hypothetical protein